MNQWAPSVQDVANILRARTVDNNGNEVGNFTSVTRPTDAQVQGLIDQAYTDVLDAIGSIAVPPQLANSFSSLVAYGTALAVELGFFPEQINSGRSPYPQLNKMYDDRLCRLQDAIVSAGGPRPTNEYQSPAGDFGGPPVQAGWYLPTW
jgi:hypothetical protein